MKLLKILLSCEGKMGLSTAQKVGLTAAVGVAAVAAGQMFLSGPENTADTVFSAKSEPEIVYVAGGSMVGEVQDYNFTEKASSTLYARRPGKTYGFDFGEEKAEQPAAPRPDLSQQEAGIEAFKMDGRFEGLSANNRAVEKLKNDLDATGTEANGNIGDIQDRIAQIAAQAQAQAAQGQAGVGAAGENPGDVQRQAQEQLRASMGQGGGKWGMSEGIARAHGNAFNSTPLQASMPGSQRSGVLNTDKGREVVGVAGAAEILNLTPKFEGGRNSILASGQQFSRLDDSLEAHRKSSAEVAANRNRSVNEGAQVFLDSRKQAGGIRVEGMGGLETLGQGTTDFSGDNSNRIGANPLNYSGGDVHDIIEDINEAKQDILDAMDKYADVAQKASWWCLLSIPLAPGAARAACTHIAINKTYNVVKDKVAEYEKKYGEYESDEGTSFSEQMTDTAKAIHKDVMTPGRPKKTWEGAQKKLEDSGSLEGGVDAGKSGGTRLDGVIPENNPSNGKTSPDALGNDTAIK